MEEEMNTNYVEGIIKTKKDQSQSYMVHKYIL